MIDAGGSLSGRERHCCFLNVGEQRFANASSATGFDLADDGRSVGLIDWDFDGDLDMWIANRTAPRLRLLRNENDNGHHYIAVRLEGRQCNRDAIGTRVEVVLEDAPSQNSENPIRRQFKTVRAGEGFQAQSSRWLHFGLGPHDRVQELTVRWPDGTINVLTDLAADRHYQIVQGANVAKPFSPAIDATVLATAKPQLQPSSDQARVVLSLRVPAPTLNYSRLDGSATQHQQNDRPLLLNLWASWCRPCLSELNEFSQRYRDIEAAGLDILALNVEQLGSQPTDERSTLQAFVGQRDWPFQTGFLQEKFYDQLSVIYGTVLHDTRPFPVPTSLLIDRDGWIVAIYRGPVEVETVLADLDLAKAAPDDYFRRSLPFAGRWFELPLEPTIGVGNLGFVAVALDAAGHRREALRYWEGYLSYYDKVPRPTDPAIAAEWDQELAEVLTRELGALYLHAERTQDAIDLYRRVLQIKPDHPLSLFSFGRLLEHLGRRREAIDQYGRLDGGDSSVAISGTVRLALLLAADPDDSLRDGPRAVELATRACQLTRFENVSSLNVLAAALAETGRYEDAAKIMGRAIELTNSSGGQASIASLRELQKQYRSGIPLRMN